MGQKQGHKWVAFCGKESNVFFTLLMALLHKDPKTFWSWKQGFGMSQPYFEGSVKMKLTFPKLGLGSPLGLPKFQSSVVGVKTPRIGVFFISLKSY
jgi:hypothetical protein